MSLLFAASPPKEYSQLEKWKSDDTNRSHSCVQMRLRNQAAAEAAAEMIAAIAFEATWKNIAGCGRQM